MPNIANILKSEISRVARKEVRAEAVRRWFKEVFSETTIWRMLSKLDDDELLEVAEGFREGDRAPGAGRRGR